VNSVADFYLVQSGLKNSTKIQIKTAWLHIAITTTPTPKTPSRKPFFSLLNAKNTFDYVHPYLLGFIIDTLNNLRQPRFLFHGNAVVLIIHDNQFAAIYLSNTDRMPHLP